MLGRRTPKDSASPQNVAGPSEVPGNRPIAGKGRPTPKRREAEKRRAPITAPTNRRDAARQARERRALQRNDTRKALVAGDENALPARDRGPLRRYVRDWADSKRTLAEFLLPLLIIFWVPSLFTGGSTRVAFSVGLSVTVLVILIELVVMVALMRRAITREFPANAPGRRGAVTYGAMRLASIRMFRLPKPAVNRGGSPRPIR
ncbi:hypothetical protein acdb102_36750 [Acidothermaceae bacterium B102]|nr:hypothetical protein acdb102_36750 [Acidothermaceae bacterium B102]